MQHPDDALPPRQVTIMTDDMDLAGDLVQDLAAHLGLDELPSRAHFPAALEAFQQTLAQVGPHCTPRWRQKWRAQQGCL